MSVWHVQVMNTRVIDQVSSDAELLRARGTFVWFSTGVNVHVVAKLALVRERHGAHLTVQDLRRRLLHFVVRVLVHVHLQAFRICESLEAEVTPVHDASGPRCCICSEEMKTF